MTMDAIDPDQVVHAVRSQARTVDDVLTFVHGHPELAHEEVETAAFLTETLERGGFTVERGIAGMATAFRARLEGGDDGPTVGLVLVFDAVPGLDDDGSLRPIHACGHGPIAAGIVSAALALASLAEQFGGRVVVVGCPADEIHAPGTVAVGGGKALSAEAGVWDDVDVALYAHPEFLDTVSLASQWMRRERLTIRGERSLQPDGRQLPLEILSRVLQATQAAPPDHVMLESVRLDGDVEEGSALVLVADVLVIDSTEAAVDERAAALRREVTAGGWRSTHRTPAIRPDDRVTQVVSRAFAALGRPFESDPPPLPFATDFGAISRRVPAALIGVGEPGGWAFHTPAGAEQFATDAGRRTAETLAGVVALSCAELLAGWDAGLGSAADGGGTS